MVVYTHSGLASLVCRCRHHDLAVTALAPRRGPARRVAGGTARRPESDGPSEREARVREGGTDGEE